ncbi:uncharacterized protein LOC129217571 [Uloborus diversus]|uniref:uncharacterized protein LOC129217571 n=1 Tax=Uloborus diversus TaxID=327109 RepID=UPI00240A0CCA|nr:uncharacterized protein LOC129217571 [Uloborus diversus]
MRLNRHFDLQSMCLNVIVGHLDFYVNANHFPEKYMAFFYRKYSDVLYHLLRERGIFCEKYMVWLLTPYWKDVTICRQLSDPKSILSKFKTYGQSVTSLDMTFSIIRPEMLKALIFCVPHLTHLDLSGTDFPSHVLACLQKLCPSLVKLNVSYCQNINDDVILDMCQRCDDPNSFRLRHLDIFGTPVSANGIYAVLVKLNHLEVLRHHKLSKIFFKLHSHGLLPRFAYKLIEFEHFSSMTLKLKTILEAWIAFCPYIEKVAIYDTIDNEEFEQISKFLHLKELEVKFNERGIYTTCHFNWFTAKGKHLTKLSLTNVKIDIVTLVSNCKNLEYLFFTDVYFTEFEKNALKSNSVLKCLKTLILARVLFSDPAIFQAFQLLVSISNLEELSIRYCRNVSEKVANIILRSSSQLELLDFSFTDITIETLLPFFHCPKLSKLYIDTCSHIPIRDHRLTKFTKTCDLGNTFSWHVDFWSNQDIECIPVRR